MRGGAIFALGALLGSVLTAQFGTINTGPRLVGFGCLGAAGPIYADQEDEFPRCLRIVRVDGEGSN